MRLTGAVPASANGASSFHLHWGGLPPDEPLVEVAVTLEVVEPPTVPELYFWALQASFATARGRRLGGAHLGLQWYPPHPGSTAVNWGGYADRGGILSGTDSALPSATSNPNTRDFAWEPGRPYRLVIAPGTRPGWWRGSVDGVTVRELHGGGDVLIAPIVWSEVFAECDDPPAAVRWSELVAVTAAGDVVEPRQLTVTYQAGRDGGCPNTTVEPDGRAFVQRTGVARDVPHQATLAL
jgi:hypothetical protein